MEQPNSKSLLSFVDVPKSSDFPIQNLPYGVFHDEQTNATRCGVAIGDHVLDLTELEQAGVLTLEAKVFQDRTLNPFITLGSKSWKEARLKISQLLRHDNPRLRDDKKLLTKALVPQARVTMRMPITIGDYTDFYSSEEHARNVGAMFRDKDNPLLPNWKHIPVGYHGRASSVVVSGTDIFRPRGQVAGNDNVPSFQQSQRIDFELELACIVGKSSDLGKPIALDDAEQHIFGFVLTNDWSARDIQKWEYVPLGPFVSKSFATSISPWIVPLDALAPYRTAARKQEPATLPYLTYSQDGRHAFDINLAVALKAQGLEPTTVCQTNAKYLYWTPGQQIAHHTITGCNLRVGDLLASGTISGPDPESFGSLLELTWNGQKPLRLSNGVDRKFLEDFDEVIMAGWCGNDESVRIGFGEVKGKLLPARD